MRAPAYRQGYVVTWASDGEICHCGLRLPYNTRDLVLDHFISAAADGRLGAILTKLVYIPPHDHVGTGRSPVIIPRGTAFASNCYTIGHGTADSR